jgi:hypothetical protein
MSPTLQPWFAHAAKWSLTVMVPHWRAVLRMLNIWVHDETLPLQALAPAAPVVVCLTK